MQPLTLQDVYRARQGISRFLPPTPLVRSAAMSEALECEVHLKLETTLSMGAFKLRGGINLEAAHQLAGGAGAAPAAAARKLKERLRGQTVVLIVSGCSITLDQLRRALADPQPVG